MMNWHNHFPSPSFANFTVLELMGKMVLKAVISLLTPKEKIVKGVGSLK